MEAGGTAVMEVGQTVIMPTRPELAEKARRIEDDGEVVDVSAHRPFLLDDPDSRLVRGLRRG